MTRPAINNHREKATLPCPECGSSNTEFVDFVPKGFPDVMDTMLHCLECGSESV